VKSSEEDKKISVIIPTYNRPNELKRCLESIIKQTIFPEEIIIIDDGNLPEIPYKNELQTKGICCVYHKKAQKGLTKSRNLGIQLSSGDIILFFDDDVILEPDYIEQTKKFYENYFDSRLGGMEGSQIITTKPSLLTYIDFIANVIFLLSPMHYGHVTVSGFSEQIPVMRLFPAKKIRKVKILGGTSFSFLKRVFDDFKFSEDYEHNYCQGEDKDFTIRVSKKYDLYINPHAKLYHLQSEVERVNKFLRGRDYVLSAYRLYSRYLKKYKLQDIFFFYSLFGLLIKRLLVKVVKRDAGEWSRIKGIVSASVAILKRSFERN